jgi:hypothetical protein
VAVLACEQVTFPPTKFGTTDLQPNTDLASETYYIPTKAERATFDKLFSVPGTKADALSFMGHPSEIWIGEDGMERWRYPWGNPQTSSCIVGFVGDTVEMALYTGQMR